MSTLLDFTVRNANNIIPSYCQQTVSCRSVAPLWAVNHLIFKFNFNHFILHSPPAADFEGLRRLPKGLWDTQCNVLLHGSWNVSTAGILAIHHLKYKAKDVLRRGKGEQKFIINTREDGEQTQGKYSFKNFHRRKKNV